MSPDSRIPGSTEVYAIDNKKGGVGKTTSAFNLGTLLAAYFGERVLLIDLDSDRCLTDAIGGGSFDAHNAGKLTILDTLAKPANGFGGAIIPYDLARFGAAVNRIASTVLSQCAPRTGGCVDLVAGSEDLADAPALFARESGQPVGNFDHVLSWLVRQPAVTGKYSRIIFDIGPGWDTVTRSGLFAAGKAIIPVEPASLSIEAFKRHQARITRANSERARAGIAGQTAIAGVLVSRVNTQSPVQAQFITGLRQALEKGGISCFKTEIPASDAVLMAMKDHVPAWAAYPDDLASQAFMRLTAEIVA
jgi:chromosome partitioning protein